jgi:LAO/AO transport system kinase
VTPLATLAARGKAGLARALSDIEARPDAPEVTALLDAAFLAPKGHAIGLTGPPGVGKSSLIDAMIRAWRAAGRTVGVIAVDPSSRRSRGALLGDRTRITTDPEDAGVFLRSMAARDRLGGVAEITFPALVLMRALFDRVIVETVGVGQSETAVAGLCDTVVLCAQPASGDALQFMKAGVMEIPDIVLVTKADLGPLAERTLADLRGALSITGEAGRAAQVLSCSAQEGRGMEALIAAIDARAARPAAGGDGGNHSPAAGGASAGAPDGRAHAPAATGRHTEQLANWLEAHLMERFGRAGLGAFGPPRDALDAAAPFTSAARRADALARAFRAALAGQGTAG